MTLKNIANDSITSTSNNHEKYIAPLVDTAKRTKALIENVLKQSQNRFKKEVNQTEPGEKRSQAQKKINKILNELKILKALPENEIISFALSTDKNLMVIASNRRMPLVQRMKARVASHKPLSTLLARVKRQTGDGKAVEELFPTKLTKISLNNQIIRMRNNIKRAKVHIIHKLTRSITKLRSVKNQQMKAKYERKAERLTKKVKRIDELHVDEIAKFALTTTGDLNKLSTDIKMPMEIQAKATIALHKFVAGPVAEYKKMFPDLQKTGPKLLKKKKRKRKLLSSDDKIKYNNSEEINNTTNDDSTSDKEDESVEEDISSEEETEPSIINMNENISNNSKLDRINDACGSDKDNESVQDDLTEGKDGDDQSVDDMDESISNSTENYSSNQESENDEIQSADEIIPTTINKNKKNHKKKTISVLKMKKSSPFSKIDSKKQNICSNEAHLVKVKSSKETFTKDKPKVVDPFFVTVENKEYLTSQEPKYSEVAVLNSQYKSNKGSNSEKTNRFNRIDGKNKWDTRKNNSWGQKKTEKWRRNEDEWKRNENKKAMPSNRKSNFGKKESNWPTNRFNHPKNKSFSNSYSKSSNRPERFQAHTDMRKEGRKSFQHPIKEPTSVKLHPSWEAKKKQVTVAAFQGKKTTFD